jgi:alkyl hydroperoxide reductase subunit AhpF
MLTNEQRLLAREKLQDLEEPLRLTLDPGPDPDDKLSRALADVVEQIVSLRPEKLLLTHASGVSSGVYPSLTLRNIRYHAVPLDHELEPFLDLLVLLSRQAPGGTPRTTMAPGKVEVLVAPTCPNCPRVVAACGEVAVEHPEIQLVIIDAQYLTELAGSCRSVPMAIIEGTHTVVGMLTAAELRQLLEQRGEPGFELKALASMIENGRVKEAVPLLVAQQGHEALAALLQGGTMQQRMGLMLAVEMALEQDPHGLDGAVPHLLPLLEADDATVRGDTADLLGQIGAPGARKALKGLLQDENPDVREMAAESLAMLRKPS